MPRIDNLDVQNKAFKKKEYRSWDPNLLEKLNLNTKKPKKEDDQKISNDILHPHSELNNQSSVENRQQIDNKSATNRQQIGNKSATNRQQIDNKSATESATEPATNRQQIDNKSTTNRQQIDNKSTTKVSFPTLIGLQKSLVIFLFHECQKARSKITQPLTLEYMADAIESRTGTIKTTLQRLEVKRCIIRKEYKRGRGGWSRFELPDSIFHEVLQFETGNKSTTNRQQIDNKSATNRQQIGNKSATESATESATTFSSSSSYINTTTTELPERWLNIDMTPIAEIGFRKNHLTQLYQQQKKNDDLNPGIIQDSINHFAFDLKHNKKSDEIKKSALSYFMGIMKRSGVYTAPANYISPREKAMHRYLERKKMEQKLEADALNIAFQQWLDKQTEEEKDALLTDEVRALGLAGRTKVYLQAYYQKNIWPDVKEKIFHHIHQPNKENQIE